MEKQLTDSKLGEKICPRCRGTGFLLHTEENPEYGYLEYAIPCPECHKKNRESDTSGIPLHFAECDLSKFDFDIYGIDMGKFKKVIFDFFDHFAKWQENGTGLYLSSHTSGSGKTMLAICLARSVSIRYDIRFRFVTAADYLSAVGDGYKRQPGDYDQSLAYRDCELLILDDLGEEKSGQWQEQEIFRLVNSRINSGKITIITSNFSQKDLPLDVRTIDRIISSTIPLPMPEISIRRQRAEKKQQEIMDEILKK